MNTFIKHLSEFNRKERFFLIGQALGNEDFLLSRKFIDKIELNLKKLKTKISAAAFVAIDFHIDWIYGSAFLVENASNNNVHKLDSNYISATQEDVDLLIAFEDRDNKNLTHLIMCECKAETGWTNKQLQSKCKRLRSIFGEDGEKIKNVIPYFVLISPKKSKNLDMSYVPSFIKVNDEIPWMQLELPKLLKKITRCDIHGGKNKNGIFWKVEKTHH